MTAFQAFAAIAGFPMLVAWIAMTLSFRLMEGSWPAYMDRRRPRPAVALAVDMLRSPDGWSRVAYDSRSMTHNTGLTLSTSYDNTVMHMLVNGQTVPLRASEKRALTKALKASAKTQDEIRSQAALEAWAQNVQRYADNVVSINRKAG